MSSTKPIKPLKVLFSHYAIIDKQGFGRSFMLARELVARGHEVTFLTTQTSASFTFPWYREERDGVNIVALPDLVPDFMRRTGFGLLSVVLRFIYIMFRHFDVYHADVGHRPSGGLAILLKKIFSPGLIYITEWWDFFGRGGQFDDKRGIRRLIHGYYDLLTEIPEKRIASGVICLSSGMQKRAVTLGLQTPVTIVPGGADVKSISFFPETTLRSLYDINADALCFGFVGMNSVEVQDIEPFLQAFYSLKKRGLPLTWFTTGQPLGVEIRDHYGIGAELTEFGWVDYAELSTVLSCADVFVLMQQPNLKNNTRWPNKIGDYLAAGRPILTNTHGEIKQLQSQYPHAFITAEWSAESVQRELLQYHNEWCKHSEFRRMPFELEATQNQSATSGEMMPEEVPSLRGRRLEIRKLAEEQLSWGKRAEILEHFYTKLL